MRSTGPMGEDSQRRGRVSGLMNRRGERGVLDQLIDVVRAGGSIPQLTPGGARQDTAVRLSPSTVVPASKIRSGNGTSARI